MPDPAAACAVNARSERGHVSAEEECLQSKQDGLGETEQGCVFLHGFFLLAIPGSVHWFSGNKVS